MIMLTGDPAMALMRCFQLSPTDPKCKLTYATLQLCEPLPHQPAAVEIYPNYECPGVGPRIEKLLVDCHAPSTLQWRLDCIRMAGIEASLEHFAELEGLLIERKGDRVILSPLHSVKKFNEAGENNEG